MTTKTFTTNKSEIMIGPRNAGLLRNSYTIYAVGTWGGGTITAEVSPDGEKWFLTDLELTADGFRTLQGRFAGIRVVLAGATAPSLIVDAL
jgi:hypothetical protein